MENRSKYLAKNVGILTISNFASKILIFLLVPLYTDILSTEEVGVFDLIVSTVSLLIPILTVNIVDAVMRFAMDKTKSKNEIAQIGMKFVTISSAVSIVVILVMRGLRLFDQISGLEILIVLYFVSSVMNNFMIQFGKGLEKVVDLGVAGIIGTIFTIGGNILFLLVFDWGLGGFFAANVLGQAVPAIYLLIRVKLWNYLKGFKINKTLQKEMILFCAPLITTVVGWWVNNASDKYVVTLMCGIGANGILAVSYKIPQVINTIHGIFTQAWQISAIKEYGKKDTSEFYGKAFVTLNVLLAGACSFLIVLSKPLAILLYKKEFYAAWQFVPFLLISCVLNSASGFCGSILAAKKDSKSMAMSAVCGAVANVIMNFLFVYLIGIQGAAIATAISSLIIFVVRKIAVGRDLSNKGMPVVVITWVLLCVQSLIEIYTLLWWVEIILMLVMVVLNLKGLKLLLDLGKSLLSRRSKNANNSNNADKIE